MKDSPCRKCADKGCGNHANCEKYLSWKKEHDYYRAIEQKRRDEDHYFSELERRRRKK